MDRMTLGLLVCLGLVAGAVHPAACDAGAQPGGPQPGGAQPGGPSSNVVAEFWETAYLQGARSGYVHTVVREIQRDGVKLIQGGIALRLTVKRFNDVIQLTMDSGTIETPAGVVVGTFMKQYLGKDKTLAITGVVDGPMLKLTLDGTKPLKPAPWDEYVLGVHRQRTLLRDKNVKPGDELSYRSFEPTVNLVITSKVKVKGYETVEAFPGKAKRKLLRVETHVDKIENLQLPPYVAWLDDDREVARAQFEVPGLGQVLLYRTTREAALAPVTGGAGLDVGISQYVRLARPIPKPHETSEVRYRITVKDADDVAGIFARDSRQDVKTGPGNRLELRVREGGAGEPAAEPGAEFTESSYFITSADPKVQELTRKAVGPERDAWKKALRIERWVYQNMRVGSHEALAGADHVAKTLEGDCTEFAMLTAAMCRAADVPSRTAVGLVYADTRTGPVFAFHMWTEVWADGAWRPIDATLGKGRIGAVHLKIADQSWHEERSLTPLLPVVRVLGKLSIEVVEVRH